MPMGNINTPPPGSTHSRRAGKYLSERGQTRTAHSLVVRRLEGGCSGMSSDTFRFTHSPHLDAASGDAMMPEFYHSCRHRSKPARLRLLRGPIRGSTNKLSGGTGEMGPASGQVTPLVR